MRALRNEVDKSGEYEFAADKAYKLYT